MWVYVLAAVSGQVHLVWARGQTRTQRANHMEDIGTRRCANPRCPISILPVLPGSARHEGVPIKPAMGCRKTPRGAAAATARPKGRVFGASGICVRRKGSLSILRARLKLGKWSTCGAEPKVMKNQKPTRALSRLPGFPESTLGLPDRPSLPI